MPHLNDDMYCSQQICIPPMFPYVLKQFAKAAIRSQPIDLLRWSAAYFRCLALNIPPPVKQRLEYPIPRDYNGLTPGWLKALFYQLQGNPTIPFRILWDRWIGACLQHKNLIEILCLGGFTDPNAVPLSKFLGLCAGFLTDSLTDTMKLFMEITTEEPEGGSASISVLKFNEVYKFLAGIDCSKGQILVNLYFLDELLGLYTPEPALVEEPKTPEPEVMEEIVEEELVVIEEAEEEMLDDGTYSCPDIAVDHGQYRQRVQGEEINMGDIAAKVMGDSKKHKQKSQADAKVEVDDDEDFFGAAQKDLCVDSFLEEQLDKFKEMQAQIGLDLDSGEMSGDNEENVREEGKSLETLVEREIPSKSLEEMEREEMLREETFREEMLRSEMSKEDSSKEMLKEEMSKNEMLEEYMLEENKDDDDVSYTTLSAESVCKEDKPKEWVSKSTLKSDQREFSTQKSKVVDSDPFLTYKIDYDQRSLEGVYQETDIEEEPKSEEEKKGSLIVTGISKSKITLQFDEDEVESDQPEEFYLPPIPGIGGIVPVEMVANVIEYMLKVSSQQHGLVALHNLRHFNCPPLEPRDFEAVPGGFVVPVEKTESQRLDATLAKAAKEMEENKEVKMKTVCVNPESVRRKKPEQIPCGVFQSRLKT